ncbi:hypothetical protein KTR66_15610 [Roseococcus sp. SDR]|uniref:hypothetical protein n=1 Tax=Roseococcus sp. SDR TaxID=2835532 RepID=UPI001BD1B081|nr:hypothetical protein [Roseococcus sp. SDR]MBS7791429.1 hypothetical protein [Roseococcus sp. SDR]MBV1846743.1 hypothetical protein [Roseococcus sp. SDR]
MTRLLALALAPALLLSAPVLAQTANCASALTVDSVNYGTQRVPRMGPGSDLLTLSVTVRNLSPIQQRFTARYTSRALQQDFLTGQSWTLAPGGRTEVVVGNVLQPREAETTVRQMLQFTCQ